MDRNYDLARGFWTDTSLEGHEFDGGIAGALPLVLRGKSVWDLGCGIGAYVQFLDGHGFRVDGVDGNPHTATLSCGQCGVCDLSYDVRSVLEPRDSVISLEVGEHIPATWESVFLNNVAGLAKELVVLSWALPRHGGRGHLNCRPNDWVIDQMDQRGWRHDAGTESFLRRRASLWYFKTNVMVFVS